mgnify:CR=1 FL=1
MYEEILTKEQVELLPLIKSFSNQFYLVGGTALALQLGHRRSVDFDMFRDKEFRNSNVKQKINKNNYSIEKLIHAEEGEFTIKVNKVKITFFNFPHKIEAKVKFNDIINMPNILDLAAMKAFVLSYRAKWRDYVDLYFILKEHYSFVEISLRAKQIFKNLFNEKLFREQLGYFNHIDRSESIRFLKTKIADQEIEAFLTEAATQPFK